MAWPRKQRGVALLVLALILIVGLGTFVYARLGKWREATTASRKVNSEVLAQAKAALIGYVVKEVLDLTEDVPGRFPCPESPTVAGTTGEGQAAGNCSPTITNRTVGRLPWRTLGIDKLVDASGEPLWYAVSFNWIMKFGIPPTPPKINAGSTGDLSFDGTNDVVAVIFAPGAALLINPAANQIAAGCAARAQSRTDRTHVPGGASPDYRDYLECQNAALPVGTAFGTAIVDNATNQVINDQAVFITAKEILNAMQGPLAERLQRTVAPLLSEHADKWIVAAGGKFLPYAVSFASPPSPETTTVTCGTPNLREGLLPTALITPGCSATWGNFNVTGTSNSVYSPSCTGSSPVTCTFTYYTLNALGALLNLALNLAGLSSLIGNVGNAGAITATVSADAPNAALSFRDPLASTSIVVNPSTLSKTLTLTPKTTGAVNLSIQIAITSGTNDLCTALVGLVCDLLPALVATPHNVTVQFPQLTDATVDGTQLTTGVFPAPHTLSLLTPVDGDPHYWFISNEWHRYTYYAIAPTTSAARSGGLLTVNGFPTANGNSNDKTFVLAVVGPAVNGQNSRPSTSVAQYLEGANASTGDNTFDYQVYSVSGNDRIATCPFTSGPSGCD